MTIKPDNETVLRLAEQAGAGRTKVDKLYLGDIVSAPFTFSEIYKLIELAMNEGAKQEREICAK